MYSLLIVILIALSSALAGFGGGWMVKGWKEGAHVAKIESRDSVLTAANNACEFDIADVQKGVKEVSEYAAERMKKAETEAAKATAAAEKHKARASAIVQAPTPQGTTQCDAMIKEQEEYVQTRRNDHQ